MLCLIFCVICIDLYYYILVLICLMFLCSIYKRDIYLQMKGYFQNLCS
jgi:hypothetical protein